MLQFNYIFLLQYINYLKLNIYIISSYAKEDSKLESSPAENTVNYA